MNCEVVVVGGGIGGLTVAALLAQRGVDVCLLERESQAGGCAASFEKFGYSFEPGHGLYTGWNAEGIHVASLLNFLLRRQRHICWNPVMSCVFQTALRFR